MDSFILYAYLIFALAILIVGIVSILPQHTVHPLALNDTRINNTTCRYTWLGGVDYDSFVENLTVDDIPVGHPQKGTVIHEGRCGAVVRMYMRDVRTFVQIYPKAGGI